MISYRSDRGAVPRSSTTKEPDSCSRAFSWLLRERSKNEPVPSFCYHGDMGKRDISSVNLIGWVGVGLIIIAYIFVSAEILNANDWRYQSLNLIGATGVIWVSYKKRIMQTVILNLFWAAIAAVALIGIILTS